MFVSVSWYVCVGELCLKDGMRVGMGGHLQEVVDGDV